MIITWLTPDIVHLLGQGILLTVILTAVTTVAALALGITVGTMRLLPQRRWRWTAAVFIDIHRNIPALVLIIFWAFAVPNLFPLASRQAIFFDNLFINWLRRVTTLSLPYYALAAGWGLTLNTSAYLAELFRAGVGTIAQEHVEAARSLGASRRLVFWHILLPQGVRAAFPGMATRLIHNMKNTALAAFVSVPEFFQGTQTAITRTFQALEFLLLAAVVYWLLSFLLAALLRHLERRLNRNHFVTL